MPLTRPSERGCRGNIRCLPRFFGVPSLRAKDTVQVCDWAFFHADAGIAPVVDLLHRRRPDAEAPAERARAARIAAPVVDPDVAALLSGLEALDRRDELYRLCAELHWLRVRREPSYQIHDAARALEAALKSLSTSPPEPPKRPGTP